MAGRRFCAASAMRRSRLVSKKRSAATCIALTFSRTKERKSRVQLGVIAGPCHHDLLINAACGVLDLLQLAGGRREARIDEGTEHRTARHQLVQQAHPL